MSSGNDSLIDIALSQWPAQSRSYEKGRILYWQGDPVELLYIIIDGAVKISSISSGGKIHSHGILGKGHILGATDYFLDSIHETTAEIIEDAKLIVVPAVDFQAAITRNPEFSKGVMQELARDAKTHFTKTQELSFLDAQQRLKQSLFQLAAEHGLKTDEGIKINVPVTHEDMGELINANRSTITIALKELKKLGYLRTEGRQIVLIPIEHMEILDHLTDSIISGPIGESDYWAQMVVEKEVDPTKAMNALAKGMNVVDRRFTQNQIELNDVLWSSSHMKDALPVIENSLQHSQTDINYLGRIVIGTVKGDLHDIGKIIVIMLLKARGFDVIDLGIDVSAECFIEAVKEYQPDVLAMSALLSTTQLEMGRVIQALEEAGLRDQVKVMIGGAPTTPRFADEIGADGYGFEARDGVELAWSWCTSKSIK
jgi:methanogenic corrinoid protein MtbC1